MSCYKQLASYLRTCKKYDLTYKEYIRTPTSDDTIILQDKVDLIWDLKDFQLKQFQKTCPVLYDMSRAAKTWCPVEHLKTAFPERR